jgi:hypothetical protein
MAQRYDITSAVQTVTATGPVTGTFPGAPIGGDFTIIVEVYGLTAGSLAQVNIEDTGSASPFSDAWEMFTVSLAGPIGVSAPSTGGQASPPVRSSIRKYQLPQNRAWSQNWQLRANVAALTGSSPPLTLRAWIEF